MSFAAALACLAALGSLDAACARETRASEPSLAQAIEVARADLDTFRPPPAARGEPQHDGVIVPTALEDPSGHALDHVREALERVVRRGGVARVLVYGGSHTAADLYTGVMRDSLQAGFGDLGHGWVMPVPPFEHYWQQGVRVFPSDGFSSLEPSIKHMGVDTYGLAGMAFDAAGPAIAELETDRSEASRIEVFFLAQPGGGTLRVSVDGSPTELSTSAAEPRAASVTIGTFDGAHRVAIEALADGPVRLYGVALGREGAGVVFDQLGLAGAKARHQLLWSESVWSALYEARQPDLVIVSYGNNETDDHHLRDEEHVAHFETVLGRLLDHAPEASCLVLGPADRLLPDDRGGLTTPPLLEVLRREQRRIALARGCAFFDVMGWQGGPGAMARLGRLSPPLAREDAIHFTELGYRRLGVAITDAILDALSEQPGDPSAAREPSP